MKTLVIFDLDDTLLCHQKPISKVPKQTYHMLKKLHRLNIDIAICSYNPLTQSLIEFHQLVPYVKDISYGITDRDELVHRILCKRDYYNSIWYIDDQVVNIKRIQELFPRIQVRLCEDSRLLYKVKNEIMAVHG